MVTRKLLIAAVAGLLVLVACQQPVGEQAEAPATTTPVPSTTAPLHQAPPSSLGAIPEGFDYEPALGERSYDPEATYSDFSLVGEVTNRDLFYTADAVVVVDVVGIGDPHLNSGDDIWWAPRHTEDPTTIQPLTITPLTVRVIDVLKLRTSKTTFGLTPGVPDLSNHGTEHFAVSVPSRITPRETLTIWIPGGLAEVQVPAEEWNQYLADWVNPPPSDHTHGEDSDQTPPDEVTEDFTMTIGGAPRMDVQVGGRYLLFLSPIEFPMKNGESVTHWAPAAARQFTQLFVNPATFTFDRDYESLEFTATDLAAAMASAQGNDPEPNAFRPDVLQQLFVADG